jgi:hypothetical protein
MRGPCEQTGRRAESRDSQCWGAWRAGAAKALMRGEAAGAVKVDPRVAREHMNVNGSPLESIVSNVDFCESSLLNGRNVGLQSGLELCGQSINCSFNQYLGLDRLNIASLLPPTFPLEPLVAI